MQALTVVKGKVAVQPFIEPHAILMGMQVDMLVLYATPQPLYKDIVRSPALAIHTDADLTVFKQRRKYFACKLATLIGINYVGLAISINGLCHYFPAPLGGHGIAQAPVHHIAAVQVNDSAQVHKALAHR